MRYFVTGATGFVGGEVSAQLLAAGHDLVVLARDPSGAEDLARAGADVHRGDITDKESVREAMAGSDGVFHIAGIYKVGQRDPAPLRAVNVEGTRNVLDVMAELAIPKGVYTSTLAINSNTNGQLVDESYRFNGKHLSHYDLIKWEAHYQVARPMMDAGLPLVTVLPGIVYGPDDPSGMGETIARSARGRLPIVPVGSAHCWSHIEDIGRAHRLAMEHGTPGEDYVIAGPVASMVEVMSLAARIAGNRPPRFRAPAWLLRTVSRALEVIANVVPPASAQAEILRVVGGATYLGDNTKAREQLAYTPRSLEAGFAEYIPALMAKLS